jgi:hypothetical protein
MSLYVSVPRPDARAVLSSIDAGLAARVLLLLAAIVVTLAQFIPVTSGLLLLAVLAAYAAPGVWFLWRVLPPEARGHAWWFGGPMGFVASLLCLLALWATGNRSIAPLVLAPMVAGGVLAVTARLLPRLALRLPRVGRAECRVLLLVLLLVPAVVALPFGKFGEERPEGKSYRAYFTADVIWAMAVVAEVSKGEVPPDNPFLASQPLRYYWLAHFLPSVEYGTIGGDLEKEQVLFANALGHGLLFTAFLFGLVRLAVSQVWAVGLATTAPFLWNSFEGTDRLVTLWRAGTSWTTLRDINIDAVTRWFYGGLPVDGLQRMLLYQPHHLAGYAIGLLAVIIASRADAPWRWPVALLTGACLAGAVLMSTFTALLFAATVGIIYAVRLVVARRWLAMPVCAVAGALPLLAAVRLSHVLGYIDKSEGQFLQFGLNEAAAHRAVWNLLLSLGPILPLALVALGVMAVRRRDVSALPAVALFGVGLAFYFLLDLPSVGGWVAWRAGHVMLIAGAVLTGVALEAIGTARSRGVRVTAGVVVALMLLLAVPTVAIDIHNAQDTANPHEGPGFPWVLRLTSGERQALRWVRTYTRPHDIVQVDVVERASRSWAYIPAFAERRMAGGLPISMVPGGLYEQVSQDVHRNLFGAATPEQAFRTAARHRIRYVYVGRPERLRWPEFETMLRGSRHLFAAMIVNGDAAVYRVGHAVATAPLEFEDESTD